MIAAPAPSPVMPEAPTSAPSSVPFKGSDVFVEALKNEGVEYIFGVPGEENLDLLESLRTSSIRLVVTRHEQTAGFMAATYGRLTGKPGVCLSTLGPGATNLVTAAAYALLGGMPMLMITGQKPIRSSRQARFQRIDTVAMMLPLTKLAVQVQDSRNIATLVREAFSVAQAEKPGPVHIELPEDIAAQMSDTGTVVKKHPVYLPVAARDALEDAADAILQSKRPLIVLGAGANRPGLAKALSAAMRRLGIPYLNTQMGKGAVNGNSHLFLGTAALSSGDYVHDAVAQADLILTVGHDTVEKPPFLMKEGGAPVIHIDSHPAEIDQIYFPQIEIVGDIADTLTRLANMLQSELKFDRQAFDAVRESVLQHTAEGSTDPRFPPIPQRLVADVRRVMPEDGIVCLDNGMYKLWFARNYRTHTTNTLLLDNALATMGAGLPSAMMAALLYPDRRVLAVCGDGGFMMNSQDMETAVRLRLNLVVLVIEDHGYGMIRWKQEDEGFADYGLSFGNPDFVKYAEAYGAAATRIGSTEEFEPMLEAAFAAGGVHLLVVPIDYSENKRVLVDELAAHSTGGKE